MTKPNDKQTGEQGSITETQPRPEIAPQRVEEAPVSMALTLLRQYLEEANQVSRATARDSAKFTNAHRRLVAAFRQLMQLRGEDFTRGFTLFQEAARSGRKEGIFHTLVVNHGQTLIGDVAEREVYVVFVNLITRFANIQSPQQKAKFAENNNIDRLLNRVSDEVLRGQLAEAFGAR